MPHMPTASVCHTQTVLPAIPSVTKSCLLRDSQTSRQAVRALKKRLQRYMGAPRLHCKCVAFLKVCPPPKMLLSWLHCGINRCH